MPACLPASRRFVSFQLPARLTSLHFTQLIYLYIYILCARVGVLIRPGVRFLILCRTEFCFGTYVLVQYV